MVCIILKKSTAHFFLFICLFWFDSRCNISYTNCEHEIQKEELHNVSSKWLMRKKGKYLVRLKLSLYNAFNRQSIKCKLVIKELKEKACGYIPYEKYRNYPYSYFISIALKRFKSNDLNHARFYRVMKSTHENT